MRLSVLFWAMLAVTLGFYLVIVLWSLPRIAAGAGGLVPFDMRPIGYSAEEARAFLAALSEEARARYLGVQHLLDTLYPALLAITFGLGFALLFRGPLLWALLTLAAAVAGFDWLENLAVRGLLFAGREGVTDAMIASASRWTLLKSVATSLAGLALLAGALAALIRRRSPGASR